MIKRSEEVKSIIEIKFRYASLFEYYKSLLTDKQVEVFVDYYDNDYSLAEIAESNGVSRNAVWDMLKKTLNLLDHYEEKLGLYEKGKKLNTYVSLLQGHTDEEGKKILEKIGRL